MKFCSKVLKFKFLFRTPDTARMTRLTVPFPTAFPPLTSTWRTTQKTQTSSNPETALRIAYLMTALTSSLRFTFRKVRGPERPTPGRTSTQPRSGSEGTLAQTQRWVICCRLVVISLFISRPNCTTLKPWWVIKIRLREFNFLRIYNFCNTGQFKKYPYAMFGLKFSIFKEEDLKKSGQLY